MAIVTGAAHGIGRAICVELAREGARVWACDVRAPELAATRAAVDAVRPGAGQTAAVDVRGPLLAKASRSAPMMRPRTSPGSRKRISALVGWTLTSTSRGSRERKRATTGWRSRFSRSE